MAGYAGAGKGGSSVAALQKKDRPLAGPVQVLYR